MDDITKAILGAKLSQVQRIASSLGGSEDLEKADDWEDVEDYEEDVEVEKSDIMHALGEGEIKISKTGKELKEQVSSVVLPKITSELEVKKSEADNLLKECGNAPTKLPDEWWTAGLKLDCGYKIYDWNETYVEERKGFSDSLSVQHAESKKINCPESQAEAESRRQYNEAVRYICNLIVDIKACELISGLDDNKSYALTPRQVITFQF